MLKLKNITKIYSQNYIKCKALDGLSLELPQKGLVAVFGASGCGKSTLLNIIGGLDSFESGEFIFEGHNVKEFSKRDWDSYRNQHVGFVFQNYYLLPHLNVRDNIAIALQMSHQDENIDEKIDSVLKEVDLLDYKKRLPKTLSGGQQQRVAIARAIVTNPTIVLADEPTGALDAKNSVSVMKLLKKISKDRLVLLVTHDEKLAHEYADRIVEISYGKIVNDTQKEELKDEQKEVNLKKTRLPILTSLKWALGNLWKKKSRTIPLIVAGGIGFLAVSMVMSMTSQINNFSITAQANSLTKYPVSVNCYLKNSSEGHTQVLKQFPTEEAIIIEKINYIDREHVPHMQEEFINYMEAMPKEYYTGKYSNSRIYFKMMTKVTEGQYRSLTSPAYYSKLPDNNDFIQTQYDLLKGHFPENKNEMMLCIDTYNRVDVDDLDGIGFDISADKISFDDVIGKEYHYIPNNSYYAKDDSGENVCYKRTSKSNQQLYEENTDLRLKIVGIVRQKSEESSIFSTPLLYTDELGKDIINDCRNSEIIKQQIAYKDAAPNGGPINVSTGLPFTNRDSGSYTLTPQYQYESSLLTLGNEDYIVSLYYCTSTFEDRLKIADYFNGYQQDSESDYVFKIRDYLKSVSTSLSTLIQTFSTILLVFSLAAVLVSMILTMVLTYITILERYKEIGLLRSIGARRKDIVLMFLSESFLIGLLAGIVSILTAIFISPAVGNAIVGIVRLYDTEMLNTVPLDLGALVGWVVPVIMIGSIISSIIASLIPTIIGANKKPAEVLKE
ncbi:MAG: ABC transporter ATP-binding protein/permease [Bacilli bacterium]|nr:ABC transporter ATP-binding protein/permease [Bacilli bacterium]